MAGKKDHIARLAAVPMFSSFTKKELASIAKAADETTLPAGHMLIKEGTEGYEGFVVLEGTVAVTRKGKKLATLGAGQVLGELALLESSLRSASVVCETECTVLVMDRVRFKQLLLETPSLSIKFLEELAGRLRSLDRTAFG
jgi:CRP/FNR family transcriptional regulator, cyclic AMP receptor protein